MSAMHLLPREEVEAQLSGLGCRKVCDMDERHELWICPWPFTFTLPAIGPDRMCPKVVLFEIMADIERTRPR